MARDHFNWSPLSLVQVVELFNNLPVPWWIAGGFALEMFVGFHIREHNDIDVGIFREDQHILQGYLSNWDLHEAGSSRLLPWRLGKFLKLGINQIWCRPTPDSPWVLEIMFMEREDAAWYFRREPKVRGPINGLIRHSEQGIPYISPEIQLVFKARRVISPKDELDYQVVLPQLDASQRQWLLSSLKYTFPAGHPWIDRLQQLV